MAENKSRRAKLTRRAFMITGGLVGTGLVVGAGGLLYVNKQIRKFPMEGLGEGNSLNAWVRIAPDNSITLAIPRVEMGQGVYTSLPMLIAEELEVEMNSIKVIQPQPGSPYANTFMMSQTPPNFFDGYSVNEKLFSFLTLVATGGSTSISDGFTNMRYAGATAREMLKQAAAEKWGVGVENCRVEKGFVINTQGSERLSYGELAVEASKIKLAELPELKPKSEWKVIGKPVERVDIPDKVNGQAIFGLDVRREDLLFAVMRHPSVIGGKITGIHNREAIEAKPGIKKVVLTEFGAAVIADNTWRAERAALDLEVEEDHSGNADISSQGIREQLNQILDQPPLAVSEEEGEVEAVFKDAAHQIIEAKYEVPYLAHATMEPLNCTVRVDEDKVEVWAGHQSSSAAQGAAALISGVDKSKIMVHTTYLGGGFGRRFEVDFVLKATAVAKAMKGTPVMTVFTRAEDMKNDMYRPAVASKFKAVVSQDGSIVAWENMIASQSVMSQSMARFIPAMELKPEDDVMTVEGARELPYHMQNRRLAFGNLELPVKVGFWRSVGSSQNAFFTECFMDECAQAAGMDPYEFRLSKLDAHPRFKKVLEKVAEISNWERPLPEGRFRGIALAKSFGSIVGQVAEISQLGAKHFSIDRYFAVIDCGTYINPNTIEAQLQSGIIFGLSAALYGEITWNQGEVEQVNFPQYDMVKMAVAPRVKVHIMENDEYPGGVGEPGTPPAAPALVNAIFAATGVRERSLPLIKKGYTFV